MAQFANVLMVIDLTNSFLKAFKLIKITLKKKLVDNGTVSQINLL